MDFEFDDLKREFLAEAEQKAQEICSILKEGYPPNPERIARMIYLAHQLKGAGGSYGFSSISTESAELERELETLSATQQGSAETLSLHADKIAAVIIERARELAKSVS